MRFGEITGLIRDDFENNLFHVIKICDGTGRSTIGQSIKQLDTAHMFSVVRMNWCESCVKKLHLLPYSIEVQKIK